MDVYLKSDLAISPALGPIRSTAVGIDCPAEHLATDLGPLSPATTHNNPRQIRKRDYDRRKDEDFGEVHGRFLVIVRWGSAAGRGPERLGMPRLLRGKLASLVRPVAFCREQQLRPFVTSVRTYRHCGTGSFLYEPARLRDDSASYITDFLPVTHLLCCHPFHTQRITWDGSNGEAQGGQ